MAYVSLNLLFRQRLFLLIALLFFQFNSIAQNLVPNPSFEVYDTCPNTTNQIPYALSWLSIYNSPDYFNACSNGGSIRVSVPYNILGFQNTIDSGEYAYAGIVGDFQYSVREMIGVKLSETLQVGVKYYFSCYFSAAFATFGIRTFNCFTDKIGVKFLTEFTDTVGLGPRLIDNTASLYFKKILSDTANWTLLSGSFIADSAYQFMVIGNFFKNENIDFYCPDSNSTFSYTYIDHICLSDRINDCFYSTELDPNSFSIFPNPSSGQFAILGEFGQNGNSNVIEIYNSIGQIVIYNNFFGNKINLDLSNFSKGFYLIKINNHVKKVVII